MVKFVCTRQNHKVVLVQRLQTQSDSNSFHIHGSQFRSGLQLPNPILAPDSGLGSKILCSISSNLAQLLFRTVLLGLDSSPFADAGL